MGSLKYVVIGVVVFATALVLLLPTLGACAVRGFTQRL